VGAWFPFHERAFAQGAVWTCARLGGAIAPLVIGALADAHGWRNAFYVLGSFGAFWCCIFLLWFRDRPEDMPSCNAAELAKIRSGPHSFKADEAGHGHGDIPWRELLRSGNVWWVCLAAFGVSFGWYFYPTWQPQFLKDAHGISFKGSELLTGLPFL